MYICYVDEAGDTGRFRSDIKDAQPVFVLLGVFLPQESLRDYTRSFVGLKRKYFPSKHKDSDYYHDAITAEIKGETIRKAYVKSNARLVRHHTGFLNDLLTLIQAHSGKIAGRVYVKQPDQDEYNPAGIYTYSMQDTCKTFQEYLAKSSALGAVICDSRDGQNHVSSHSIFTQMYKSGGDSYPNIIDMPTFGDSRNHAGIQTADILCSTLIYPMAVHAYCSGHGLRNTHVQPKYSKIRELFCTKLAQLQFRYDAEDGQGILKRSGGLVVSDSLGHKHGSRLFNHPDNDEMPSQAHLKSLIEKFAK